MSLFRNTKLVKRSFTSGERVKGSWVEGTAVDTTFEGTAQPASGKAMELLPEGKRSTEAIQVFAPIEIEFTPADDREQRSGDRIIWKGREYEVQVARQYDCGIIPHWELVAVRV